GRGQRRRRRAHVELRIAERRLQQIRSELSVVLHVVFLLAALDLVQRWLRNVGVAALDELAHGAAEEREQQRADVRAFDIRVGHDDDAVVAHLVGVEFIADAGAERSDQRADFGRRQDPVEPRALDVQDLAFERQDRLRTAFATLLRRTAGRITLDGVYLAQRRAALPASGELTGPPGDALRPLAQRLLARI